MAGSIDQKDVVARILSRNPWKTEGALAQELGMSPNTWTAKKTGKSTFTLEEIAKICDVLGVGVGSLLGFEEPPSGYESSPSELTSSRGFSLVPRYTVQAAAGNGRAVLEELEADRLAFRSDWLRGLGVDPTFCGLVTAVGDSQEPTIPNGALMLVDMRPDQSIRSGCFYIIVIDGDALVKRLNRRLDGSIELLSDNPAYPIETIPTQHLDRLNIPGRVVWFGRTI